MHQAHLLRRPHLPSPASTGWSAPTGTAPARTSPPPSSIRPRDSACSPGAETTRTRLCRPAQQAPGCTYKYAYRIRVSLDQPRSCSLYPAGSPWWAPSWPPSSAWRWWPSRSTYSRGGAPRSVRRPAAHLLPPRRPSSDAALSETASTAGSTSATIPEGSLEVTRGKYKLCSVSFFNVISSCRCRWCGRPPRGRMGAPLAGLPQRGADYEVLADASPQADDRDRWEKHV